MTHEIAYIIETIIKAIVIFAVFATLAGFATYVERKILGFFHRRLGPMLVGPHGVLQLVADMVKLFTKEDIIPKNANQLVFKLAPLITAITAFSALAAIPFFPEFSIFGYTITPILADVGVGVLYVLGVSSVGMYGSLLAGMSSSNKWAMLGGARAVAQLLSFEVVQGLSLLAPIMLVGSLSLIDFNNFQNNGIPSWLIFKQPIAFLLFLIATFAETNRIPMDLLEADTEITAGFTSEYSGMRWGMFFIGEYGNLITASFLVSLIFLGGFNQLWFIPGSLAIILKVMFLIFFFMWVRAAYPRIRPDQLMWLCWKVLMPLAVLNILVTGIVLI